MIKQLKDGVKTLQRSFRFSQNKDLQTFISKNVIFWTRAGSHQVLGNRVIIAEHALGTDYWSLVVSISASIVAAAFNAKVIFLMQGKPNGKAVLKKIQRSFCSSVFIYLDEVYNENRARIDLEAERIFNGIKAPEDILDISYKNIPIGEQVYDAVIKYKHATLWFVDERVLTQIINAIICVEAIDQIDNKYQLVAGMFTHTTCTYHGVAVRTIITKKLPVYLGIGGTNAVYRYNSLVGKRGHVDIHIKIPQRYFNQIYKKHFSILKKNADDYFLKRFGGEINDWDAVRAFSPDKKLYKDRLEFFKDFQKLDPNKKNVFIMLHAMNDDPHVQVQHIFKDYYEWFAYTLKFARLHSNVNWIFKQHPMIKFYPDDANLHGLFDLIDNENHIIYIDENTSFNSASIAVLADTTITCAGTAGLEFSAFGIPAIITAGNSYSGYSICCEPQSKQEYHKFMEDIHNLPPVKEETRIKAKVLFYLIYSKLIPSFQTGFFPQMTFDQMKALTIEQATSFYNNALNDSMISQINEMKSFIVDNNNSDKDTAELFLKIIL